MRRPLIASLLLCTLAMFASAAFVRSLAPGRAIADDAPARQPEGGPGTMPPSGMPPGEHGEHGGPGGPGMGGPPPPFDTSMAHVKQDVDESLARLGPKADMPAESVFKNVQIFKGQTAAVLIKAMHYDFSYGLSARCGKCHVHGDFSKDDKDDKKTARQMYQMMLAINTQYLAKMKLEDDMPTVRCWTCHRGRSKPEELVVR